MTSTVTLLQEQHEHEVICPGYGFKSYIAIVSVGVISFPHQAAIAEHHRHLAFTGDQQQSRHEDFAVLGVCMHYHDNLHLRLRLT